MKALGLIIQREYSSRVRTKAFILTTILVPLLFIVMSGLPTLLMSVNEDDISKVYVIDDTGLYFNLLESTDKYTFQRIDVNETLDKSEPYALLRIDSDLSENPSRAIFLSDKQQPPKELTNYINGVLTNAVKNKRIEEFTTDSNIDPQAVAELQDILKSRDRINVTTMRWNEDGQETNTLGQVASFTGMAFTFCMFFFIIMYGSMVMQSVVEEKTNRIVEVIISSVKPFDLMMGKIIGVALTGLTQLLVWIIIAGSVLGVMGVYGMGSSGETAQLSNMLNNPEIAEVLHNMSTINWLQVSICFILYFIGGYLIYASLFAMFGSAANDSQEAHQFIFPVTITLTLAFYAGFYTANNPEGPAAFWCSIIPFTSPMVMMVRTPFEIPLWEIVTSLVLLYATAILMVKLAGKIYRTGILMYGKKVSFKELFKWLTYK